MRRARFISEYNLPEYDADILTSERSLSDYFETSTRTYAGDPKRVSNWLINDVLRMLNEAGQTAAHLRLTPAYLASIIRMVDSGTVNTNTGKALLEKVNASGKPPEEIVETEGLARVSDNSSIRAAVEEVISENPNEVINYRGGKTSLLGWFVGQVMRKTQGKADAQLARSILTELLEDDSGL